jgi:hypothetical protein
MVYNPGNQIGKSVRGGGQRPAKDPDGPFLGKSATSKKAGAGSSNVESRDGEKRPKADRSGKVTRTVR